jgi:predicted dehydrogenase
MNKQNVTRRGFLKGAAGSIAFPYFVPSCALGKAGSVAPSNRIVMAAVGIGSRGYGNLREFLSRGQTQFVAVCDVDQQHNARAKRTVDEKYDNTDCQVYGDFRKLFQRKDIDAVLLSLPDHWHATIGIAAAKAGYDVYGEKPLARTIKGSRAIVDAVKKYGTVWQTGSQQRSNANFHHACELVRNGRIGKVSKVDVGLPAFNAVNPSGAAMPVPAELDWDMWLGPAPWREYTRFGVGNDAKSAKCHWNWRWISDYAPGILSDWGAHHIDIAQWGLGFEYSGPSEIQGKGEFQTDGLYDTADVYNVQCKYASGVIMNISNCAKADNKSRGATWYGEKGWVHVNRNGLWAEPESILNEVIGNDEIRLYKSKDHKP